MHGVACQRRGRFLVKVTLLPKIIGDCVVVSAGEEGAWLASAVGQAAAVHGAAGAGWSIMAAAREVEESNAWALRL